MTLTTDKLREELTDAWKQCPDENTDQGNVSRGIENCSVVQKALDNSFSKN
jgi:hypothetical protein